MKRQATNHHRALLTGRWDFTYTPALRPAPPALPARLAFTATMPVPGYWDDHWDAWRKAAWWPAVKWNKSCDGQVKNMVGIGWYRRYFSLPPASDAWKKPTILLEFNEVMAYAHVWVNRRYAGSHAGCRTPFSLDISALCRRGGVNELIVAIGNDAIDTVARDVEVGGYCGGILGVVSLRVAGPGAIRDLWARAGDHLNTVALSANIAPASTNRRAAKLHWRIQTLRGSRILAEGSQPVAGASCAHWTAQAPDIKPWSPDSPNLYLAIVELVLDGKISDRFFRRFGVRRWSYWDKKLKLNDVPIFLRSDCRSTYFPRHCATPFDKAYYLRLARRLKVLGFNAMKFLYMIPPRACFEAADEVGLVVQITMEYLPWNLREKGYIERAGHELRELVRAARHYPSLSIYRLSGERYFTEGFLKFLTIQYRAIKAEDPGALVLSSHCAWGIETGANLLNGRTLIHPYPHAGDWMRRLQACSDIIGQLTALSYGCPGDNTWRDMEARGAIYNRPLLAHEIGMKASYLDLGNASRYTSRRLAPIYYRALREKLAKIGLLHKAARYYRASCRLQQLVRKYCIEENRMIPSLAGYEYLGASDHFMTPESYPCGFMNEFLELKPGDSIAEVRQYQDESVLLLDWPDRRKRTFWSGERFEAVWRVSHYGAAPIERARLTWEIRQGGKVLARNRQTLHAISNGAVMPLMPLILYWPNLKKSARVTLRGTLAWQGGRIANAWDFWIFPCRPTPKIAADCDPALHTLLSRRYTGLKSGLSANRLRIVARLAETDLKQLEKGRDVLLLGTEPFDTVAIAHPLAAGHSSMGNQNAGTLVHRHAIFRDIPHEGFGDWQFFPVLRNYDACIHFKAPELPFDPILEVIASDKDPRRQASIFEARVGRGRLFVYASGVDVESPSAVILMDAILRHVQSRHFAPRLSLGADWLRRRLAYVAAQGARLRIKCGYRDITLRADNRFDAGDWRTAPVIRTSLAATLRQLTMAEQAYNAGGGVGLRVDHGKGPGRSDFKTEVRVVHDRRFLHVHAVVTVTALSMNPDASHPGCSFDLLRIDFPCSGVGYQLARKPASPWLTVAGAPELTPHAAIETKGQTLHYFAALPLPRVQGDGSPLDWTKLDTNIDIVHQNDAAAPRQVIQLRLALHMVNTTEPQLRERVDAR